MVTSPSWTWVNVIQKLYSGMFDYVWCTCRSFLCLHVLKTKLTVAVIQPRQTILVKKWLKGSKSWMILSGIICSLKLVE